MITPTDIDGFIEYKNKIFIIIEGKFGAGELRGGQKLAFERLTDALTQVRPTLFVFYTHQVPPEKDVPVAEQIVKSYRTQGQWNIPHKETTVFEIIDSFLDVKGGD